MNGVSISCNQTNILSANCLTMSVLLLVQTGLIATIRSDMSMSVGQIPKGRLETVMFLMTSCNQNNNNKKKSKGARKKPTGAGAFQPIFIDLFLNDFD